LGDDKKDDRGRASGRRLVTTMGQSLASRRIAPYRSTPLMCAPFDAQRFRRERM